MLTRWSLALFLLSPTLLAQEVRAQELRTEAELSGFRKTGRYAEVERLCRAFESRWPQAVRRQPFGTTPEGRTMEALVVNTRGILSPEQARQEKVPVLLVQGGIHSGEIDGKDAGFLALRQLLEGGGLDHCVFVFVPVFNIDGHERFGPWNRPNQSGPEEMGWRTTSTNLNLNRDYTKADAPEMVHMLNLLQRWDPIVYVDLHATDGAQFQHDIANLVEPIHMGAPGLQPLARKLSQDLNQQLRQQGSLPLDFYPSPRDSRDPLSGFAQGAYTPRFSTGYWALCNRLAILVETHSWKDYPWRVQSTRNLLMALVQATARDGQKWLQAARECDQASASLPGTRLPISYKTTEKHRMIDFQGYRYSYKLSAISGQPALHYEPGQPQVWRVPLYEEVVPDQEVVVPRGYYVPPAHAAWMSDKLRAHGISFEVVKEAKSDQALEVFRASRVDFSPRPSEGRQRVALGGQWSSATQSVAAGSLWIPTAQPRARLLLALLEPLSGDSFVSWGFFNAHFEQKEYMEDYVAEEVASKMLQADPNLAREFQEKLRKEPDFARDHAARLQFFYRRHPSWDQRFNLYPVQRLPKRP